MFKKLLINTATFFIASILLSSCSNNFVSTNLDQENFKQYFSASHVKIYKNEKEFNARYKFVGLVEGYDCQTKPHHAVPDEINARTQARRQAFNINANGIVFSGCAMLTQEKLAQLNSSNDAQQCHAVVICYAKAYTIEAIK